MKIDRIEAINLLFKYDDGLLYAGGTCTARVTTLVRVHTDSGQVGVGSAYSHPALSHLIIERQLAPFLIGEDPAEVERHWRTMYQITRWYGRKGVAMSALGAIDTALWDLRAQALGKPLWRVLGGTSGRCAAYASALLWKEPEALASEAAGLIDRGFRRVKMRLGRGREYDWRMVSAVRAAIGESCDLMVDGSMRYDVETAAELAKHLEENRVFWFEEPFEPESIDDYVALRKRVRVPLAAGENEFGFQGFRELVRAGSVDIVQPDASRCGGISEVRRVAELAAGENLQVATHTWSDAVAIVANAHVISALPNGLTVEIDQTGNPFVDALLTSPLSVIDGELELGESPGLGVQLNESVLERYRMKDPLAMPDGAYSDMVFGKPHFAPAPPYH